MRHRYAVAVLVLIAIFVAGVVRTAPVGAATEGGAGKASDAPVAVVAAGAQADGCERLEIGPVEASDDRWPHAAVPDPAAMPSKVAIDRSGPVVALLVDRYRIVELDDAEGGMAPDWQPWRCDHQGDYRCTGTLVHARFVLTAAHCASAVARPSGHPDEPHDPDLVAYELATRVGSPDPAAGGRIVAVSDVVFHPGWSSRVRADGSWESDQWDMADDLALLRLAEPVGGVDVAAVTAFADRRGALDSRLSSYGWGEASAGPSSRLQAWLVEPVEPDACSGIVSHDPERMVCTAERDGSGTCIGDSGAPLRSGGDGFALVGVVAFVTLGEDEPGCASPRLAAFTALDHDDIEWIGDVIAAAPAG